MKVQEIREIIKLVDQSNISEFVFENEGTKIKLKKTETGTVLQPVAAPDVVQANAAVEVKPAAAPAVPKAVEPAKPAAAVSEQENLHKITSPMVGTFYQSPAPDSPAYVKTGDKVTGDSIVCIVEAMKLFNEIEAEVSGEIVEVLVKEGQLVEYGQPLFLVKPE
ncbi:MULTISPECIES: acetyl-CoA carboxylase biotin carboxyl carrier protein [Peribacillus]|jgi:acetyl-CoA carboxylase biotin carboxyl carrier protein|uniref:Biotin carboxyl carrier protein of acetyl-CoA carboxylase n=1 Tax=Peribacillus simplex TaxID=1478 RepID=A0A9W4L3S1_9BACI|nr:acetyl-CoA carboxylase biotin carboxyl carrier protein [Peribacillus simplex]MDR4925632.1 acetyl-CoA carboxylase biotin carboxyl carrier protein [Peribacillus simplex]WHX89716.1 acetyl-CoA carboxylase biotin carboxyl carrier protein [Peribacillus simplex]CAH0246231.1 Biotin carboxyl carrier protein of acetyl-CoA carboxylase [Peribacillus simplex]